MPCACALSTQHQPKSPQVSLVHSWSACAANVGLDLDLDLVRLARSHLRLHHAAVVCFLRSPRSCCRELVPLYPQKHSRQTCPKTGCKVNTPKTASKTPKAPNPSSTRDQASANTTLHHLRKNNYQGQTPPPLQQHRTVIPTSTIIILLLLFFFSFFCSSSSCHQAAHNRGKKRTLTIRFSITFIPSLEHEFGSNMRVPKREPLTLSLVGSCSCSCRMPG